MAERGYALRRATGRHEVMAAPALPLPPENYDRHYMSRLLNVLRLYFVGDVDVENPVLLALSTSRTVTGDTTLSLADGGVVLASTSLNAVTITLPDATKSKDYQFIIKRITAGVNPLVITAISGTIDDGTSATITVQYVSLTFRSDGTNWWIV